MAYSQLCVTNVQLAVALLSLEHFVRVSLIKFSALLVIVWMWYVHDIDYAVLLLDMYGDLLLSRAILYSLLRFYLF